MPSDLLSAKPYNNLHVIVVDDHSTDNSNDITRGGVWPSLTIVDFVHVRLTENGGQAAAIRKGLALLDTPFVCFLDQMTTGMTTLLKGI